MDSISKMFDNSWNEIWVFNTPREGWNYAEENNIHSYKILFTNDWLTEELIPSNDELLSWIKIFHRVIRFDIYKEWKFIWATFYIEVAEEFKKNWYEIERISESISAWYKLPRYDSYKEYQETIKK